ncbi:MAG TPA: DHA2 family efflux MFS transporter permease subunit, partial [Terriglobales bacterium]|nr:DHA2 family efflux MFS transporter permease subunit [Terriglobales bacterium]
TLGGWLTESYSWRWAFYINIPIGILATFLIFRNVKDPDYITNAKPGPIDSWGLGLLALWLGCLQIILDKGQEDDWFGATWIRWATFFGLVALVLFLVRQLRARKPLVDLCVFKNRNFAVGCLLITLFGAAIYGLVTMLPLFYQELMGYTALNAGIAVSPRGLGAIIAMPVIGLLTARLDNRWLIGLGFFLFALCSLAFGTVNLAIGPWSFLWAIIISGFASGMVFVPLSTTAMGTLTNEQIGNASGLYNLLRNVGGSVGISLVNTIVARHEQVHRNDLAHSLSPSNPILQQRLATLERFVSNPSSAYAILDRTLNAQARLLAYVDDFRYMALLCFACLPLVFLLKRAKAKPGAVHAE